MWPGPALPYRFSGFSVRHSDSGGSLEGTCLGPHPGCSDSKVWGGAQEVALLPNSQLIPMLLVQGSHSQNHFLEGSFFLQYSQVVPSSFDHWGLLYSGRCLVTRYTRTRKTRFFFFWPKELTVEGPGGCRENPGLRDEEALENGCGQQDLSVQSVGR